MDARGHGRSDKPHDEAQYTMELRTADIVAVLDAVGVDRVHYWGYSMGARTGFAFLQMHADRAASFVNGASGPRSPKQLEQASIRERAAHLQAGRLNFRVSDGGNFDVPEGNDPLALAAVSLGLLSWDGVDASTLDTPSLHYAGDADRLGPAAERAARVMPGAKFRWLPGLDHLRGFERCELVVPFVREFVESLGACPRN
jgi:pimeloyl-ACP methyl ester carboxylesterase